MKDLESGEGACLAGPDISVDVAALQEYSDSAANGQALLIDTSSAETIGYLQADSGTNGHLRIELGDGTANGNVNGNGHAHFLDHGAANGHLGYAHPEHVQLVIEQEPHATRVNGRLLGPIACHCQCY